jgi:hypothetical protein
VLSVKEMRALAGSLPLDKFRKQMGPFALIQRPENADTSGGTDQMGLPVNVAATQMAKAEDISNGTLGLLFEFEDLEVVTLPPMTGAAAELTVGRQPDCDLVLEHGSVSKVHAVLRWDDKKKFCTLKDLGSTNGTFLNASIMVRRETLLRDGDIISFGDVQFWYLLTDTLHAKISGGPSQSNRLGSRSG